MVKATLVVLTFVLLIFINYSSKFYN